MELIWTNSATTDPENIFAFIAEDDLDTACQIDTFIQKVGSKAFTISLCRTVRTC